MEAPLNWKLISHPINWLTVGLMLVFLGIGGHLLLTWFGVEPGNSASKTNPIGTSRTYPKSAS